MPATPTRALSRVGGANRGPFATVPSASRDGRPLPRRVGPPVTANRRTALLEDLLRGIAEITVRPNGTTVRLKPDTTTVLLLAEEAIRIDPAAALLRQAAADLQHAAAATDAAMRTKALAAAAAAAASEARKAHADAPLAAPTVAPALSGAFADALRRDR